MLLNNNIADLIKARVASGSLPGQRRDGRHLALAIEGGGMRGVVSAGMVAALEEMGLRDCFDSVYGASAGAAIAAYFVAGQARYGSAVFYNDINNRDFIDVRRLGSEKPVLSLDYLIQVCANQRPLDTLALACSTIPLNIVAASVTQRKPIVLSGFATADAVFTALKASARIPVFAGDPVAFRNDHFLDASLYESIPHASACHHGATDVVALLTRPKNNLPDKISEGEKHRAEAYFKRFAEIRYINIYKRKEFVTELMADFLAQDARYYAEIKELANDKNASVIQLDKSGPFIQPLEISRDSLLKAAKAGYAAAYGAFGRAAPIQSPFPDSAPRRNAIAMTPGVKPTAATLHP